MTVKLKKKKKNKEVISYIKSIDLKYDELRTLTKCDTKKVISIKHKTLTVIPLEI